MMRDVFPTRWRLLPFGSNVMLVSSAQRVGRASQKTQGFHFINCRVYRVRERVSHKTQGFHFINCRVYRVVERVSHKTQGFNFYQFIKQAKHIHGNRYTLNSNTSTTRSENSYKRSGARTPSNVREFKRLPSKRTTISTS